MGRGTVTVPVGYILSTTGLQWPRLGAAVWDTRTQMEGINKAAAHSGHPWIWRWMWLHGL